MPQILTRRFGAMDFEESSVLDFPLGLPGFENARRFALVEPPDAKPLVFLQSLDFPELCFVAAPVLAIDPAYQLDMTSDDLRELGFPENCQPRLADQVTCLAILSLPENGRPTANLLAPLVIQQGSRRAVQAVRVDSRYSHQQPLPAPEALCS
jgi:flagellar assembly factor FliW